MRSSLIATLKHVTLFTSDVLEVGLRAIVERQRVCLVGVTHAKSQPAGGRAVLFTAVRDRHGPAHTADLVCDDPARLPHLIANLPGATS